MDFCGFIFATTDNCGMDFCLVVDLFLPPQLTTVAALVAL
jgi:hypothetical protein